jgi:hypothetical protein
MRDHLARQVRRERSACGLGVFRLGDRLGSAAAAGLATSLWLASSSSRLSSSRAIRASSCSEERPNCIR